MPKNNQELLEHLDEKQRKAQLEVEQIGLAISGVQEIRRYGGGDFTPSAKQDRIDAVKAIFPGDQHIQAWQGDE